MITLRIATAMATTLVGSSALFADCEPPPPETCDASAPVEGCECEVEGESGCEADGEYHSEGFVCVEGAWTDLAGTPEGDEMFCGSGFYGGCFYNIETGEVEIACAVPGFIGIARAKGKALRKAPRRVRPARSLRAAA